MSNKRVYIGINYIENFKDKEKIKIADTFDIYVEDKKEVRVLNGFDVNNTGAIIRALDQATSEEKGLNLSLESELGGLAGKLFVPKELTKDLAMQIRRCVGYSDFAELEIQ